MTRVAVFGCGSIGLRHLRNLRAIGGLSLAAFDVDPQARARAGADADAETFASDVDLFDWHPDIVLVAAPTADHAAIAAEAIARRCAVFVEKPIAGRLPDGERLAAQARQVDAVTMVGCNMRFHPGPSRVKRLLDQGAIGRVLSARIVTGSYLPEWRPHQDYRRSYSADLGVGGALLDCIHEIDLALWYLGPATLHSALVRSADAIGLAVDGMAELLLEHGSGAISSVHVNFVQRDYRRGCEIVGTEGTIYWDFRQPAVLVRRSREDETHDWDAAWPLNDMYVDELREFLACARDRRATSCPFDDGVAALRIACAARAVAKEAMDA